VTGRANETARRYAVLGHPVRHSLSPPMQGAAFRASGIDARYDAIDVTPDRLEETLARLHAEGAAGLNLTLPLKEAAWALASTRTAEAERAGAVNTLRREDRGWAGHATDGLGFAAWIEELGITLQGARVLLLGAGGAARSVAPVVLDSRPHVLAIASRTAARARALAERLEPARGGVALVAGGLDSGNDPRGAARAGGDPAPGPFDLAIRALSAEEVGDGEAHLWRTLRPDAPMLDLNYGARAARVKARCSVEGRRFEDGAGLLLHQGALSFEFWTGRPAPVQVMREALAAAIG
jgi:shikimate dehydrogenase